MNDWYRSAVFYEVLVRSFRDSNGDGIGDLPGLTQSLDYVEWLGVDCLWLPPVFESPMLDGGYDVADFYAIQPELGTVDDLADLLAEAHRRDIKVISDMVMNHTSFMHSWFQEARTPGSDRRDWYVWNDEADRWSEARIIFLDTEASNWTWDESAGAYFWHRFYSHQPDLNYDNPDVRAAMLEVIQHWLGFGFDGFRLDAVPYLFERDGTNGENLPETHQFLKEVRAIVDRQFPDAVLLAEANQWPRDVVEYFGDGDESHMNFHFPVMPRLFMGLARGHAEDIRTILADTPDVPPGGQWGLFLRNHDELTLEMVTPDERDFMWEHYAPDPAMRLNEGIRRRLAPLLEGNRNAIELLHGVLFSLLGSPVLYYGDEIGMGDEYLLPDRDGVRTPMQWTADTNAGFSEATPTEFWLPLVSAEQYAPAAVNVAAQQTDEGSLLVWIRHMLALRKSRPEMGLGSFELVDAGDPAILAYLRKWDATVTLVLANFADRPVTARTTPPAGQPVDVMTRTAVDPGDGNELAIDLAAHEFRWIEFS